MKPHIVTTLLPQEYHRSVPHTTTGLPHEYHTKMTASECIRMHWLMYTYMYRLNLHVAAELHPATFLQDVYSHSVVLTYSKFSNTIFVCGDWFMHLSNSCLIQCLINFVSFNTYRCKNITFFSSVRTMCLKIHYLFAESEILNCLLNTDR